MSYLKKTWIRVLVSLIIPALGLELWAVGSSDPNYTHSRRPGSLVLLILAAVCYLLLTAYVKRRTRNDQGKLM